MSSVLELESTPEVQDLRKKVGDFLTEFIYPNEKILDRYDATATATMKSIQGEAKKRGLWALGLPKEIGGGGLPFMHYVFVNEKDDAIDHAEGAFDFAAEIGVAGGVHDVDFGVVEKESGVLGENGDAALAFEVIGIHDALDEFLIGAKDAALAKHGVDESGFAVVDVGDDSDIAYVVAHKSFICLQIQK